MKKIVLIIILAGLGGMAAARGEISRGEGAALFREANVLYERGDFAGAAAGYLRIVEEGWESAPVYYNLGNAYFKENRLGPAILYYRKAQDLAPLDPEINKNLEYAREALQDDIAALPLPFFRRAVQAAVRPFPLGTWIGVAAGLYFLTLLWLAAARLFRPLRKVSPPILKTILPLLVFSVVLVFLAFSYYRTQRGIILIPAVAVRYGPQETDATAFNLHEGTEVRLVRERNGWIQIALPDGTSGWLPTASLGKI